MTASQKQRHPARQRGGRVIVPVRRLPLDFQIVSVLMTHRKVSAEIAAMNRAAAMRLSNRGGGP